MDGGQSVETGRRDGDLNSIGEHGSARLDIAEDIPGIGIGDRARVGILLSVHVEQVGFDSGQFRFRLGHLVDVGLYFFGNGRSRGGGGVSISVACRGSGGRPVTIRRDGRGGLLRLRPG